MTSDMFGSEMFVAFSDGCYFRIVPGDSRRAILSVAVGDIKSRARLAISQIGTKFRLRQNRLSDLYEHAEEI